MATIVKLGEPKPPPRKDPPAKSAESSTSLADLMEHGVLLKVGAGVGIVALLAAIGFFLLRGPAQGVDAAPAVFVPPMPGPHGTAPGSGGTAPAIAPAPGLGPAVIQLNPEASSAAPAVSGAFAAPGGRVPPSTAAAGLPEKKTQPAPHEDPYALQNR